MTAELPLLALHEPGHEAAGDPWRSAFPAAGWRGPVVAPDLPGHGATPAPGDGAYELADAALAVLPALEGLESPPVVVGVGANGWAAELLALAGRARSLVLVDGLGGPWRSPAEAIAEERRWLRAVADDPEAVAPPPPVGLDPRLRHGVRRQHLASLALRAAAAVPVPTLVLESPASPLTAAQRDEVVAAFADAHLVELGDRSPGEVAAALVSWVGG